MVDINVSQFSLNEVDLITVVVDECLQKRAELVWMINENLQNFFNLDWLLVGSVGKLRSNFLSTGDPNYLTGNDLHMVHKSFLAKFYVRVSWLTCPEVRLLLVILRFQYLWTVNFENLNLFTNVFNIFFDDFERIVELRASLVVVWHVIDVDLNK